MGLTSIFIQTPKDKKAERHVRPLPFHRSLTCAGVEQVRSSSRRNAPETPDEHVWGDYQSPRLTRLWRLSVRLISISS